MANFPKLKSEFERLFHSAGLTDEEEISRQFDNFDKLYTQNLLADIFSVLPEKHKKEIYGNDEIKDPMGGQAIVNRLVAYLNNSPSDLNVEREISKALEKTIVDYKKSVLS